MIQGQKAVIDEQLCAGCGICIDICPTKALEIVDGTAKLTKPDLCGGKGCCVSECPMQAIELK